MEPIPRWPESVLSDRDPAGGVLNEPFRAAPSRTIAGLHRTKAVHQPAVAPRRRNRLLHSVSDGLQLIRNGRDLVFYIARARTPMPKSTREYIERCETYVATGKAPFVPAPLPA